MRKIEKNWGNCNEWNIHRNVIILVCLVLHENNDSSPDVEKKKLKQKNSKERNI